MKLREVQEVFLRFHSFLCTLSLFHQVSKSNNTNSIYNQDSWEIYHIPLCTYFVNDPYCHCWSNTALNCFGIFLRKSTNLLVSSLLTMQMLLNKGLEVKKKCRKCAGFSAEVEHPKTFLSREHLSVIKIINVGVL